MKIEIYKIFNKENGWCYIGSTNNFKVRKYRHLKDLRKNIHHCIMLQKDFNKYDEDTFQFSIIDQVDEKYRNISEDWYIQENITKAYNTRLESSKLTENTRRKISDKNRTWEVEELKTLLKELIHTDKTLKSIIQTYNISESIFQHTIISRSQNQFIIDNELEELIKIYKSKRDKLKIMGGLYFKNPNEDILEVTKGLNNFAKEHGLNAGNLSSVKSGNRKQHKGWTLYAD